MTQEERVLNYIKTQGSITSRDAFLELGISRLANPIYTLRKKGIVIVSKDEQGHNRFGEKINYKRYRLGGDEQ